jgi:hypothetical protein
LAKLSKVELRDTLRSYLEGAEFDDGQAEETGTGCEVPYMNVNCECRVIASV